MENQFLNPKEEKPRWASGAQPRLIPLTAGLISEYLYTGRAAYRDHYCHLWPGGDPDPYLRRNFTEAISQAELENPRYICWLIYYQGRPTGICKLDLKKDCSYHPAESSLFLEKIYFRKAFTGQGIGGFVMEEILQWAARRGREFIWLESMQKGPALAFYRRYGFEILSDTQVPYPEVLEAEKKMWVLGKHL